MPQATAPAPVSEPPRRRFVLFNLGLSALVVLFVGYVVYVRRPSAPTAELSFLPAVNAALNLTAALLLGAGYAAIRRGARDVHRYFMVAALAASALFLVGYLSYYYAHGDTKYPSAGAYRALYLAVLASHVLLSMTLPPLVLATVFFAARGQLSRHRRLAKITLPVWLYVSVTGVLIFLFLRQARG